MLVIPAWDPRVMARGLPYLAATLEPYRQRDLLRDYVQNVRVLHASDGTESSVLVYDFGEGTNRAFVVNGRHEAPRPPATCGTSSSWATCPRSCTPDRCARVWSSRSARA